jgi:hypothetical protein
MGNDLFVKNRWILGGILNSFHPGAKATHAANKKLKVGTANDTNTKANNPALI